MAEENKSMLDFIRKIAPGTGLRTVVNDLNRSDLGALIVFEAENLDNHIEGGFRVNCRFTSQRLFELCKMDGAIIVSSDLRRILHANVLIVPDPSVLSEETGTRHKAAEKIAKQLNTPVIAVSERKKKTTLFLGNSKHELRSSEEVFREITNTLQILEKQKESFNELISRLNILEISNLASVGDVCKILQKGEIILRNSEMLKKGFIEIGREGVLMNLRYKELMKGIEEKQENIIRDYSKISLKKTRTLLENLSFDGLLDLESIARLVFEKELEDSVSPRGYRFFSELDITEKDISLIVSSYKNLQKVLDDDSDKINELVSGNIQDMKKEIQDLKEKIIEGRIVV